jgi:phage shock protein PspC (stress-responsive transcriptional regulator)
MTERKWYRYRQDRILGGVSSGLAGFLEVHPAFIRLTLILVSVGFFAIPQLPVLVIVGYFLAWALLPEVPVDFERSIKPLLPGLVRPKLGRRIEGVCAGIARAFKLEVNLVRLVMVILVCFGGLGLVTYVAGWILMPNENNSIDSNQDNSGGGEMTDAQHVARDQKGDRS